MKKKNMEDTIIMIVKVIITYIEIIHYTTSLKTILPLMSILISMK